MSDRWSDWAAIEATQQEVDNPKPKIIQFPRQSAPERPTEAVEAFAEPLEPEPPQPERPRVSDARGMKLLIRWYRTLYQVDEDQK